MLIRSLVRVRLTKYFPSDRYIKNRCSRADAILIDMERGEDGLDEYKMASFDKLKNSEFPLPKLLIDPVDNSSDEWTARLISQNSINGVIVRRSNDEDEKRSDDSWDDTVFTMIWDPETRKISHSIISYHRINDGDMAWNSSIRTAVTGSLEHDIQPLASRTLRFTDMKTAVQEFTLLRQIGFTGAVIRNPNLIDMTNQVFGTK